MALCRLSLAFGAVVALTACGDPFPEDFTITVDGTAALGFASPAEFSDADIQNALAQLCVGGVISNYTTETGQDGTKFFGANCARGFSSTPGSDGPSTIYVTRQPNGAITFS